MIERTGHLGTITRPRRFAEIVKRFADRTLIRNAFDHTRAVIPERGTPERGLPERETPERETPEREMHEPDTQDRRTQERRRR
jgi:hypothetical protein